MPKIAIDAGHGGRDPGAVYNGRQEKDDNLAMAMALGEILEDNGIEVVYTRTDDVYDSPSRKADIANQSGADYFVSLHRNAVATPGTATGITTLVYENSGIPAEMAENVNQQLAEQGWRDLGIMVRPNITVLRRTNMPAILVEAGFIDNEEDNEKFDSEFQETIQAIANGILQTLGIEPDIPSGEETPPGDTSGEHDGSGERPLYRVQVAAYRNKSNADRLMSQLMYDGYPAFIILEDDLYKVQVGAFEVLENAIRMEQRLRRAGYSTWIRT